MKELEEHGEAGQGALREESITGEHAVRRERPPWTGRDIALALLSAVLVGVALTGLVAVIVNALGLGLTRGQQALLLSACLYAPLAMNVWLFTLRRHGAPWSAVGFRRVGIGALMSMVPMVVVVLFLNVVVAALISAVTGGFTNPQQEEIAPGGKLGTADFLYLLVAVSVVAPVVEEMTFRGMLYRYLRGRTGVLAAVLISATIFAIVHLYLILLPILFVTGIVLALIAERYNSILPSILLHALNNGVSLTALYIGLNSGAA